MIEYGEIFAGIGGFSVGMERAGFRCAWQIEIDPQCNRVRQRHWPNVQTITDVRNAGKHNLKPVDLICFGWQGLND